MRVLPRRILAICAPLLSIACGSIRPPQPPSLVLPKPPADLRASRKGEKVILTWTVPTITTDRQNLRSFGPTRICRGLQSPLAECGTPIGRAAAVKSAGKSGPKISNSYTDTLPAAMLTDNPNASVIYAVEVLNADGRGAGLSNQVHTSLVRTLPAPADFSAKVTSQGVVLDWPSNAPPATVESTHYVYRVYRRPEGSQQQTLVGEVPSEDQRQFSLTDSNIEWEKTYEYHAEAVTVVRERDKTELQIDGDNTPEIKVFADDVFPPAVPSGLQAVFSGIGQQPFIDLIWAPDTDADLDGYNVYRHEEGMPSAKVNRELVKTPAYRDLDVKPGTKYFYSVSAVDLRGNESAHSEEASESVP